MRWSNIVLILRYWQDMLYEISDKNSISDMIVPAYTDRERDII
jgi:hypothetical protein